MSIVQVTQVLVAVNIILVGITIFYAVTVYKQLKQSWMAMRQSQIATLKGIRYRLEGDVTQIRVMKAQIVSDKAKGLKILKDREEKELSPTIKKLARTIEELEKRFKL